jgi:hypothetical protein
MRPPEPPGRMRPGDSRRMRRLEIRLESRPHGDEFHPKLAVELHDGKFNRAARLMGQRMSLRGTARRRAGSSHT